MVVHWGRLGPHIEYRQRLDQPAAVVRRVEMVVMASEPDPGPELTTLALFARGEFRPLPPHRAARGSRQASEWPCFFLLLRFPFLFVSCPFNRETQEAAKWRKGKKYFCHVRRRAFQRRAKGRENRQARLRRSRRHT
ncbi:hypothetical protein NHX12_011245 [Muraenolepis orangiensis]|uniref:Uncharacterized protein n=1 Tax=Muraenolepis orangiensis TaxID=630683 RepID=A0A9Q0DFS2_9TELE|nr:hypothetical protein NHX12_011245 [Muraenolepis orangiensis]